MCEIEYEFIYFVLQSSPSFANPSEIHQKSLKITGFIPGSLKILHKSLGSSPVRST
jgi:hypothetical protein